MCGNVTPIFVQFYELFSSKNCIFENPYKCKKNYGCIFCCCRSKDETTQLKVVVDDEKQHSITSQTVLEASQQQQQRQRKPSLKKYDAIILDCSLIQFIDESGVKCLKEVIDKYSKENVKFLLTYCNGIFERLLFSPSFGVNFTLFRHFILFKIRCWTFSRR